MYNIYVYVYTYTQHQTIYTQYSHTVNIVHIIYGTCFANPRLHMIWLWLETSLLTFTSISPPIFHRHPNTKDQLSTLTQLCQDAQSRCHSQVAVAAIRSSVTSVSNLEIIGEIHPNHLNHPEIYRNHIYNDGLVEVIGFPFFHQSTVVRSPNSLDETKERRLRHKAEDKGPVQHTSQKKHAKTRGNEKWVDGLILFESIHMQWFRATGLH